MTRQGPKCGSMNGADKRDGRPCDNPAGMRTVHLGFGLCYRHGGNSQSGNTAGLRLLAESEQVTLEATARQYAVPIDTDPRDGLLAVVAIAAGWWHYWTRRVNELERDELAGMLVTGTEVGTNSRGDVDVETRSAANHIVVLTWERATRDFRQVCKDAAQAGVEERRVQLAESQGELLAQVVATIVSGLGRSMEEPEVEAVVKSAMADAVGAVRALPSGS